MELWSFAVTPLLYAIRPKLASVSFIFQAVLCTKGVSERARATAYTLISELGEAMIRWNSDTDEQGIIF